VNCKGGTEKFKRIKKSDQYLLGSGFLFRSNETTATLDDHPVLCLSSDGRVETQVLFSSLNLEVLSIKLSKIGRFPLPGIVGTIKKVASPCL
jgi:hypothetical protein